MNPVVKSSMLLGASIVALLAALNACSGIAPVPLTSQAYWETENNDSSRQADTMSLSYSPGADGYDYTGRITADDTSEDWYRLTTTQSGQLAVSLTCRNLGSTDQLYLALYSQALYQLDSQTLSGDYGTTVTVRTASNAAAGTYYIRIAADGWNLRYDLAPSFNRGAGNVEAWEIEDNDSPSQADSLPLNYRPGSDGYDFTGVISAEDRSDDWYRLTTLQSGQLAVTLTCWDLAYHERIYITLYDSWLEQLDATYVTGAPGGSVTVSTSSGEPAGVYYVRIDTDSWTHRYDLTPDFHYFFY